MGKEQCREFLIHKPTGSAWAVERHNGWIVAAAGPVDAADAVPALLDHLMYFRSDAEWVSKNVSDFAVWRDPALGRRSSRSAR
jgi:hypothetical protein